MKTKLLIPCAFLSLTSLFISCEVEDNSQEETTSEISTSTLTGFLNSEDFTSATTHFEAGELFGEAGYRVKLFQDATECTEIQSIGDVSFFIESETELSPGTYDAQGPYFYYTDGTDSGTVSFFGADVIIEEVTDDTISGRVKGGDEDDEIHYIEGAFTATLCQQ